MANSINTKEIIEKGVYIGKMYTDKNIIARVIDVKIDDDKNIAELFIINKKEKKIYGSIFLEFK